MNTSRDILSTSEGYQDSCGGGDVMSTSRYVKYIRGIP